MLTSLQELLSGHGRQGQRLHEHAVTHQLETPTLGRPLQELSLNFYGTSDACLPADLKEQVYVAFLERAERLHHVLRR